MIQADDLEDGELAEGLHVQEYTIRLLLPIKSKDRMERTLTSRFQYQMQEEAIDVDVLSRTPIGKAIRCPRERCGLVAFDMTEYPHGLHRYGGPARLFEGHIYCPACEGGEDV